MAPKLRAPMPRSTHIRRALGLRVEGRIYRTVFTPDRKAGGYWVKVPELPGCVTEGDTVEEAKRMAREAIALWIGLDEEPSGVIVKGPAPRDTAT